MNLQSEIDYFTDLPATGQARLLALVLHELSVAARATYGVSSGRGAGRRTIALRQ